jgi:hypothetical protein
MTANQDNLSVSDLQEQLKRQKRELEEARDERAALAEVLRVISASTGELEQPDGDAGDDECADRPVAERLRRLIRSDRCGDVIRRGGSGVVWFVGWHRDQRFGCAAAEAEERSC